jgi:hypothetical protein
MHLSCAFAISYWAVTRFDAPCRYIGQVYRHPLGDGTVEDRSVKVTIYFAPPSDMFRCHHLLLLLCDNSICSRVSADHLHSHVTPDRPSCAAGACLPMLPVMSQGKWRVPANPHVGNMGLASDYPVPVTSTVPSKFGVRRRHYPSLIYLLRCARKPYCCSTGRMLGTCSDGHWLPVANCYRCQPHARC